LIVYGQINVFLYVCSCSLCPHFTVKSMHSCVFVPITSVPILGSNRLFLARSFLYALSKFYGQIDAFLYVCSYTLCPNFTVISMYCCMFVPIHFVQVLRSNQNALFLDKASSTINPSVSPRLTSQTPRSLARFTAVRACATAAKEFISLYTLMPYCAYETYSAVQRCFDRQSYKVLKL
jgi:hypothetical protein